MTNIVAVVATEPQKFAEGTEQVDFLFMLVDSNGNTVNTISSPTPTATFPGVAPGVYSVKCLRYGYV
ncbi:MAG TPA: hypothetical protein VFM18_23050, partial [Methanosarcina sp.]|nr:hypothetical protein [Methanosarcina sp.]